MRKKYSMIISIIFVAVLISVKLISHQIVIYKYNKLYESYEEKYYTVIKLIDRDSFYNVLSDGMVVDSIGELNRILIEMEKYDFEGDFNNFSLAQRKITNILEASGNVENWEYLSDEEKNELINDILIDKYVFLSAYEIEE